MHLFPSCVLEKKIPVDANVICDFLDDLCATLVLSIHFKAPPRYGVITLPRSWLMRHANRFDEVSHGKDIQLVVEGFYVKNMRELLEQIFTGEDAGNIMISFVRTILTQNQIMFSWTIDRLIKFTVPRGLPW